MDISDAAPAAEAPAVPPVASILDSTGLLHLLPKLSALTLDDVDAMVQTEKAVNMAHLKELGVDKLQDRQKLCNALSKARRMTNGYGMPVLVCLYGSGITEEVGHENVRGIIEMAQAGPLVEEGPTLLELAEEVQRSEDRLAARAREAAGNQR